MSSKRGFTLIEVMIAVMIISVVVSALIKLQSDNTFLFSKLKDDEKSQKYITLLIHSDYGLENKHFSLDRTIDRFDVDDDLRRSLKRIDITVKYKKLQTIDLSKNDQNGSASGENLEIGKTTIQFPNGSYSYIRVSNR